MKEGWEYIHMYNPGTKAITLKPPKYALVFDDVDLRNIPGVYFRADDPANYYTNEKLPKCTPFREQKIDNRSEVMVMGSLSLDKYCRALLNGNHFISWSEAKKIYK